MSATTQYTSFSDIYTGILNALRNDTSVTASVNQAKRAANSALHDMHIGFAERLPWAERRAILVTQPSYTTGTLTATKGSTTITGSSTAWNTNNSFSVANMRAGGKIRINGGNEVYEISTVTNDTSATMTSKFTQDTVSAASYVYYEDEYALASDFLRPLDLQQFSDPMDIKLIGRTDFRRLFMRNYVTGRPQVATLVDLPFSGSTTPVRKVCFYKPPDIAYSIPYSYITSNLAVTSAGAAATQMSSDTDEPIVPVRYRHVIVLGGLYHLLRDAKDDDRALQVKGEYEQLLTRLVSDTEIGASTPYLVPRTSGYTNRARRPYAR